MSRWLGISVFAIGMLVQPLMAAENRGMTEAAAQLRRAFARLDANHDQQLELVEFSAATADPRACRRDFELVDFDRDGRLTRTEFACLPGQVEPPFRGSIPDPYLDLVDDAVVALDESYDRWDQRPSELVSAHTFVSNFLESISPEKKRFVTGRIIDNADRDTDGRISRSEAKEFLEQQLGLKLKDGPPLRESTGRLVRYDRFLAMDQNHDQAISREEFHVGWWLPSRWDEAFATIDGDGNGRLSYDEFAQPDSPTFFDAIVWFCQADRDLDAHLSEDELRVAVEPARLHLAQSAIRSFDDEKDGKLSLREYQLSMLGNYNYPWERRPLDQDRDGRLSYDEFVFDEVELFQLQRWYFFHRLDLDQDGSLTQGEFEFRPLAPLSIRAYSTKSTESKVVHWNRAFPDCGWPSVSPDGTQLLLHECPPSGPSEGRIVAVSLEDGHTRMICHGIQPSWSADGKHFVCERRSRDSGIWILDAGGLRGRRVAAGHGPKWSPDGRSIAFLQDNGISIFDVETEKIRQILLREDHPYQDLGTDIAWSPDGRRLAVVGNFAATSQLLILPATADGAGVSIRYSFDFAWRGNLNWMEQDGIVMGVREHDSRRTRMISLIPDSDREPEVVNRFADLSGVKSACLTPDGRWYIAVAEE